MQNLKGVDGNCGALAVLSLLLSVVVFNMWIGVVKG
jgi:hypothetical protein